MVKSEPAALVRRSILKSTLVFSFAAMVLVTCAAPESGQGHTSSSPAAARVLFLGDTSFGENYQERLADAGGENVLKEHGYDHMMANFAAILDDTSLVAANLETPITDLVSSPLAGRKRYIHYAHVEETPRHLAKYGIGLVSLANNHAMDFGGAGLAQTLASLTQRGIATCGAGPDESRARRAHRHNVELGPMVFRMAVICAFEFSHVHERDLGSYAGARTAGVNPLAVSEVAAQVHALRREDPGVFVVVFAHWGRDYHRVTANQRLLGRALVDAGVDLVVGHGAHLLQGLELYKGRWIVYGIGNFIFGSPGRYALFEAHPYSAIAELTVEATGGGLAKRLRLYPIVTDNAVTGYRGRFVSDAEYNDAGSLLVARSYVGLRFEAVVHRGRNRHGRYFELSLD